MDKSVIACKCILFTSFSSYLDLFNKFGFTYKTIIYSGFIIPIRFMGSDRDINGFIVYFNRNPIFNNLLSCRNYRPDYWHYSGITRRRVELSSCRSFGLDLKMRNGYLRMKRRWSFFYNIF